MYTAFQFVVSLLTLKVMHMAYFYILKALIITIHTKGLLVIMCMILTLCFHF